TDKGGTMRLGAYSCELKKKTKAAAAYGSLKISERHRHRYEFNNLYLDKLTAAGLVVSGINPQSGLVEIIELADHPWFVGVQFHPELKSTVENPHPLFVHFVKAALTHKIGKG
ncbi:MAG: glutamine amidotransferase-related protein, partial [Bacteroidota bacterium]